jgi:imidazoleglycerol-phosphate dehydratase
MSATGRKATIERKTNETRVRLELDLDGSGERRVATGLPFYDHMLEQIARHGLFDLVVEAEGDLEVDAHHTVEDVALSLGEAFAGALGDRAGIVRYGSAKVPLDEALSEVTVDFGGRPYLVFNGGAIDERRGEKVGTFPAEMVKEVFQAFSVRAGANVHVNVLYGENLHHCIEATFKAFARACRMAVATDPRDSGVPSTKGTLSV